MFCFHSAVGSEFETETLGLRSEKGRGGSGKLRLDCLMPCGLISTAGMDEQLTTTVILQLCPWTSLHEKIRSLYVASNGIISLKIQKSLSLCFNWTCRAPEPMKNNAITQMAHLQTKSPGGNKPCVLPFKHHWG